MYTWWYFLALMVSYLNWVYDALSSGTSSVLMPCMLTSVKDKCLFGIGRWL